MYQLAHRGYSDYFPENTMSAFRYAFDTDFDGIETDVQQTKDGRLVLLHDYKINRTSTGKGLLKDWLYHDLLKLKFSGKMKMNTTIPSLEELLCEAKESGKIVNLEIKSDVLEGTAEKTVQMVKDMGVEKQVYYSSVNPEHLMTIKKLDPNAYCAMITERNYKQAKQLVIDHHFEGLHARVKELTDDEIKDLKARGIAIGAWTVKSQKDFDRLKKHDITFVFTNTYFE